MSKKVYENSTFIVLSVGTEYILMNKRKPFKTRHTHLHSFDTARWLMRLSRTQAIPSKISSYLLESLIRVSDKSEYVSRLLKLQNEKG